MPAEQTASSGRQAAMEATQPTPMHAAAGRPPELLEAQGAEAPQKAQHPTHTASSWLAKGSAHTAAHLSCCRRRASVMKASCLSCEEARSISLAATISPVCRAVVQATGRALMRQGPVNFLWPAPSALRRTEQGGREWLRGVPLGLGTAWNGR